MTVWLVYKCMSDTYGTEALVGVFSTEELANNVSYETAHTLPGYQTRVQKVEVQ